MKKISIDFDATLSRPDVQKFVQELMKYDVQVQVTTSRYNEENKHLYLPNPTNDDMYKVTDRLGIERKDIQFTNRDFKNEYLPDNALFHLDDDEFELEIIERYNRKTIGVNVNNKHWQSICWNILNT